MKKSSDILLSLQHHDLEVWKVDEDVCVSYHKADLKDGIFLVSTFGSGPDFEAACDDYLDKIRGKTLVFNAGTKERKELAVLG